MLGILRSYLLLLKQHPAYIAFGFLHFFFSGPGQTFFISLYTEKITESLGIDNVLYSSIYSGATMLSAFTLPWVGNLLDKIQLRKFSLGLGSVYVVFCLLASQINGPILLFAAIYGLRLSGQGLMPLTGSTAIARHFESTRGKALSLVSFGVSFSEMIFPFMIVALIGWIGWQNSWLVNGGIILLIFIPLALTLVPANDPFQFNPKKDPNQADDGSLSWQQVLKTPSFYLLALINIIPPMFFTGVMLNQNLIREYHDWPASVMALGLSAFGFTRLLGNILAGPLIDKFTATRMFAFMLMPMLLGMVLLISSSQAFIAVVFFVFCGVTGSFNSLTSTAMWAEIYGVGSLGTIRSMVSTIIVFSTAVGSVLLSWTLSMENGLVITMLAWGVLVVLAIGAAFWQVNRIQARKGKA